MKRVRLVFSLVIVVILLNLIVVGYSAYFLSIREPLAFTTHASSQGTLSLTIEGNDTSSGTTGTTGTSGASGSSGGGGGGGAGYTAPKPIELFSVNPEEINLFVVAGSREERSILVVNKQKTPLTILVSVTGVSSFVASESQRFVIAPGESRNLTLIIKAPDSGIYGGRVVFESGSFRKEVTLLLNVQSSNALFDVSLTLPESYKVIRTGLNLKAFISLLEVGPAQDIDVTVKYIIKDFDDNTLYVETETFRVFRSKSYVKEFRTNSLGIGDYLVGIEVSYSGGFATASSHFSVSERDYNYYLYIVVALFVVSLIILAYSLRNYYKYKHLGMREMPHLPSK